MALKLFKLRAQLPNRLNWILTVGGLLASLLLWVGLTSGQNPIVNTSILPKPLDVFKAYKIMYQDNNLIQNITKSVGLNLAGYVEALFFAVPLGFLIGLMPFFRSAMQRQVDAIRYIPLTAVIGIFVTGFGLGIPMKVHFLAFGIFIYLLPVVVQRIDEVKDVYLKTVYTLGATDWQTIKTVYFPSVMSRLSDDIRVLTAISWTYIIVAESLGNYGGIGASIWRAGIRLGRMDKVYALLIIIMILGVLQDKIFIYLDKKFFGFKFQTKNKYAKPKQVNMTALRSILKFVIQITSWIAILLYLGLALIELFSLNGEVKPLYFLFGPTIWVIHFIVLMALIYKVYNWWYRKKYDYV